MLDWRQDKNLWLCYKEGVKLTSQWVQDSNQKWYYLDDNGIMATGWKEINGFFYYLNPVQNVDKSLSQGQMLTGWIQDGVWYYLCPNKIVNYGIEYPQGSMITDFYQIDGKWYFFLKESNSSEGEYKGQMVTGTKTINGKDYTFNNDGSLKEDEYILSANGAKFIGSWEGFWSQAQYDPYYPNDKRYITIGFGTTYEAMPSAFNLDNPLNTSCTVEEATTWLQAEAQTCGEAIKSKLDDNNVSLSVNAIDSLISFSYNCGTGALFNSTLWRNILNGITDRDTISTNFYAYSKANGVTSQGLLKRRQSEVALYFDADYTGNN